MKPCSIKEGIAFLRQGKIVAYPTEAVFGLGCDPLHTTALEALLLLKQRASNKGLILIASALEQLLPFIDLTHVSNTQWQKIQATWPGPFTWVFPATAAVLPLVKGDYPTVAVRVTAHPVARALCEEFGGALISTSANIASQEPLVDAGRVIELFGNSIDGVIEGKVGGANKPTTIQDACTGQVYR
jgi:L-threonylcarbamoyladenylate synthase